MVRLSPQPPAGLTKTLLFTEDCGGSWEIGDGFSARFGSSAGVATLTVAGRGLLIPSTAHGPQPSMLRPQQKNQSEQRSHLRFPRNPHRYPLANCQMVMAAWVVESHGENVVARQETGNRLGISTDDLSAEEVKLIKDYPSFIDPYGGVKRRAMRE
jgi:hypothetical protein